jgi:hypothetical protein
MCLSMLGVRPSAIPMRPCQAQRCVAVDEKELCVNIFQRVVAVGQVVLVAHCTMGSLAEAAS